MARVNPYVEKLKKGETISYRPVGNSMTPRIESGNLVTVCPDISNVSKGDIVMCKCKGRIFCHLVTAVQGNRYQISNNHGHVNGWIGKDCIYGQVIKVEP
jgi:phage repressor protein C with HTH and peptisase S24 domain